MNRIRISKNVVLEITDAIESININESPKLLAYDFGADFYNRKMLLFEDGQNEDRENSYISEDNIFLSSTPNFYPDDKISANFHDNKDLNTILSLVSNPTIQYKKVRMLFAQGFSYSTVGDGVAMTTLNISAIRPSNNQRVDLLSVLDTYDNSKILAIPEVLFDNQVFNSAIEFRMLDLQYLFTSENSDVIEIKEYLFGTDDIDTLFVEHAGVNISEIVNFSEFGKQFTKFYDADKSRSQFSARFSNDEIVLEASVKSNGTVSAQIIHERFDLESMLKIDSTPVSVEYTFLFSEYKENSDLIGNRVIKLSNPIDMFSITEYRLNPQDESSQINVEIECVITMNDNSTIRRSGQVVIANPDILKVQEINLDISEDRLTRNVTKDVRQVVYKNDTPKIVNIDRPVFVKVEGRLNTITLTPFIQTVRINTDIDLSLLSKVKLMIGNSSYENVTDSKTTFTVGSESFYTTDKTYYLLDENNIVVSYGNIERIEK
ncbi:hypothetical protein BPT24_097 [Tenacibaculum phage pT24]|uniref:Uncharacterized protein n=1 Tax=Tenacibaculum phage pT24 TaxID=1880590 RepID=A0A1B4XWN0_9CAUD|nr:hypothetical protein HYP10_gp097 [Tenacibaculum phage pT24]BAV39222.1 hypothetical protein BPT24_097 [Tenacibaculum phage pT24]